MKRSSCLLAAFALAVHTPVVRADLAPPPTFVGDSIYLPFPFNLIVGIGLLASAVAGFFWLRRLRLHKLTAIGVAVAYFVVANLGIYFYAISRPRPRRERPPRPPIVRPSEPPAPIDESQTEEP